MAFLRTSAGYILIGGKMATAYAVIPVYVSSVVQNATPTKLEITYDLSLANIVPATSAFEVEVAGSAVTVSSIAISTTKVTLTLASAVTNGQSVTVAYTKPGTNPIQTSAGGQAASYTAKTVTNNVAAADSVSVSPTQLYYYWDGSAKTNDYVTVTSSGAWAATLISDDYGAVDTFTASGNTGDKCYITLVSNGLPVEPQPVIQITVGSAFANIEVYQDSL